MGDVHPFAEAIRSRWAMPTLNGSARLCRGPVIRRTNLLRPTDASPLRLIRCARALAEASRSRWAMYILSPRQYVYDGRCTSIRRGDTFTMGDAHPLTEAMRSPWAMHIL